MGPGFPKQADPAKFLGLPRSKKPRVTARRAPILQVIAYESRAAGGPEAFHARQSPRRRRLVPRKLSALLEKK
jgi:hypothetical protein